MTGDDSAARAGLAGRRPTSEDTTKNAPGTDNPALGEDAAKRLEELGNATSAATVANMNEIESKGGMGNAVATAVLGAKGREKDKDQKSITAKDIFNNMNQAHKSKDSDRKFSAGPAPAGSGGGSGGGGQSSGGAQPMAPVASYRAPEIAQNSNIISGSAAGQAPVQVVAVPVQVDASSLLGHNDSPVVGTPAGLGQPPLTGTGEKAKARAQKYLFDAEKDLDDDRDRQDILGHKDKEAPTEQPHVMAGKDRDDSE